MLLKGLVHALFFRFVNVPANYELSSAFTTSICADKRRHMFCGFPLMNISGQVRGVIKLQLMGVFTYSTPLEVGNQVFVRF